MEISIRKLNFNKNKVVKKAYYDYKINVLWVDYRDDVEHTHIYYKVPESFVVEWEKIKTKEFIDNFMKQYNNKERITESVGK